MVTTEKTLQKRYNSKKGMVVVKKYRDSYKLTYHNNLRMKGFVDNEELEKLVEGDKRERILIDTENGLREYLYERNVGYENIQVYVDDLSGEEYYVYDIVPYKEKIENPDKLANNICRAKSTIYELALCNDWDYFCTFTIDKTKYDRYDLSKFHKDFVQKIRNLNKKYKCKINYLLVPEKHKDGAWHMHGFLSCLPGQELRAFGREEHLPLYILDKIIKGHNIYTWTTYQEKFGFCDLEPIKNIYKASAYITKYVSKTLAENITELGAHTYYASKGLNRAEVIMTGYLDNPSDGSGLNYEFENEYVKVHWMDKEEFENVKDFIDKE